MNSFFRYPGGKSKIKNVLYNKITDICDINIIDTYIEPFLGGGGFALHMIEKLPNNVKFVLSDVDKDLICLWKSVHEYPQQLIEKIKTYTPSVDSFFIFRNELLCDSPMSNSTHEILDRGFKKLVLHQTSFSGLGLKAGSPIGGIKQNGNYKIDCRWNVKTLEKKILSVNNLLSKRDVHFLWYSFEETITRYMSEKTLIYLDPPYFEVGNELYHNGMSASEHMTLSSFISKNIVCKWLLSYNDCEWIRDKYGWANVENVDITYDLINKGKLKELLITKSL